MGGIVWPTMLSHVWKSERSFWSQFPLSTLSRKDILLICVLQAAWSMDFEGNSLISAFHLPTEVLRLSTSTTAFSSHRIWALNWGHQSVWQMPSSPEPPHWTWQTCFWFYTVFFQVNIKFYHGAEALLFSAPILGNPWQPVTPDPGDPSPFTQSQKD